MRICIDCLRELKKVAPKVSKTWSIVITAKLYTNLKVNIWQR